MKHRLSPRRISILLLAVFGLLIVGATILAIRFTRDVSIVRQSGNLRDYLEIIAREISENLDKGSDDPYEYVEIVSRAGRKDKQFSYVLADTSGSVLAPAYVREHGFRMKDIRPLTVGMTFLATVQNIRCFVVEYDFPDRPLVLLGIYDNRYIFDDVDVSIDAFVILISVVFLVLLLVFWLWAIPALERLYERRNRAEDELRLAHNLQQKAVTLEFPDDDRCRSHAVLQAMKDVGGDLYVCEKHGGKLYFGVGDVSDKGTEAAFVMFLVSSVLSSCFKHGAPLDEVAGHVNQLLLDNDRYEMFCTLFLGCIDLDTLDMEYVNAGHTKTILDGSFLDQDPQLIVGVRPGFDYRVQQVRLHPGSRLLVYTDGVTEARAQDHSFFGAARLLAWMQARPASADPRDICTGLLDTLAAFRGKAQQNDDIAILCIQIV